MRKRIFYFSLFFIILLGILFRTYNFSDWLHFETDQVDDVRITESALEKGIGNLPLGGPKAGAKLLRIPPAFYYLEYTSAKIIGNKPFGHAFPVMIFSILSLPIFYLFARRYFSKIISLALLAVFSFSFYLVLYSRFSWNPNILPFFMTATFFTLLLSVSEKEKHRELWFIIFSALFGFTTQLHYNALIITAGIVLIFLVMKRPNFNWKIWIASASIIIISYAPFLVHEIATGGFYSKLFLEKTNSNSNDETNKDGAYERLIQNFRYGAGEFFLIISGEDRINGGHLKGSSLGISCVSCRESLLPRILGYIFYICGCFFLVIRLCKEKEIEKRDFLILISLWFTISFLYFWNLLLHKLYIYPRFFLVVSPIPVIFLGLILDFLKPTKSKKMLILLATITGILLYSNSQKIFSHFKNLNNSDKKQIEIQTEDIFPNTNRVTISMQKKIIELILRKIEDKNKPVYILSESEFEPVYWYFLEKNGVYFRKSLDYMAKENQFNNEGYYFAIIKTLEIEDKKMQTKISKFKIKSKTDFGSLTLFEMDTITKEDSEKLQSYPDVELLPEQCQANRILKWKDLKETKDFATNKVKGLCEE